MDFSFVVSRTSGKYNHILCNVIRINIYMIRDTAGDSRSSIQRKICLVKRVESHARDESTKVAGSLVRTRERNEHRMSCIDLAPSYIYVYRS